MINHRLLFIGINQLDKVNRLTHDNHTVPKRSHRLSLGAVLFVMLGGRYPFDGKAMPLEDPF